MNEKQLRTPQEKTPQLGTETQAYETKYCTSCASKIPKDAKLCVACKSYQSRVRSFFQFYSSVAALIGAIVSMIVWLTAEFPRLRAQIRPKVSLILVRANSMNGAVLYNAGDLALLPFRIVLSSTSRPGITTEIPIEEWANPGQFIKVPSPNKEEFTAFGGGYWAHGLSSE